MFVIALFPLLTIWPQDKYVVLQKDEAHKVCCKPLEQYSTFNQNRKFNNKVML